MLNITGRPYDCCDRLNRRTMLKLGTLALGQVSLAGWLRSQARASTPPASRDMSVILLWQGGGPSHLDMWDLKPDAPNEFRGTFSPIATNLPGCDISEHMPSIAKICDKLAIIRSATHNDAGHESASHFLLTGYKPTVDIPANEVPSYGSIVAKELGPVKPKFPAMDSFAQQAWDMVTSPQVQEAFNLKQEDAKLRERYGRNTMGQSVLMARRLVEAGVRFVTVDMGGWDTHGNNFETLKKDKLPQFDACFSTLIEDLHQRGRLNNTMILVWGEFGRTPRINPGAGRDHWPNAFSVVMAGGGLRCGQVIGSSDARAEFPRERPISPQDVLATMYRQLGIDREKSYANDANRPVPILNYGEAIKELI
jgi:hypothetical protein